jgi:protein TonB
MIRVNNKYPPAARSLHQQGTVVLHMHMARDGRVLDASILKSTGFPLLDEAARNLVLHMRSFPPLPDAYLPGRDDYAIDQPVSYQL